MAVAGWNTRDGMSVYVTRCTEIYVTLSPAVRECRSWVPVRATDKNGSGSLRC